MKDAPNYTSAPQSVAPDQPLAERPQQQFTLRDAIDAAAGSVGEGEQATFTFGGQRYVVWLEGGAVKAECRGNA